MTLKQCPRGHYYDGDKFSQCPHCDGTAPNHMASPPTVPLAPAEMPDTRPLQAAAGTAGQLEDGPTIPLWIAPELAEAKVQPVVGWLVCLKGKHIGKGFSLKAGRNSIGRAKGMDVCLAGETTVSKENHTFVLYEPVNNQFLVTAGHSSSLCYANGEVVITSKPLKKNDRLQIGEVELMFIPCCDASFSWQQN